MRCRVFDQVCSEACTAWPVSALSVQLAAQRLSSPCTLLGSMIYFEAIARQEQNQPVDTDLVTTGRVVRNHNLTDKQMNQRATVTLVCFETE